MLCYGIKSVVQSVKLRYIGLYVIVCSARVRNDVCVS